MREGVDVVVIGAGQHGLSASYWLKQAGLTHTVYERGQIGASWRGLWDSFRTNTPKGFNRLAEYSYAGPDPEGFSSKAEVVDFLESYARRHALPVECDRPVVKLTGEPGRFRVETDAGPTLSRAVIVATGPCGQKRFPKALLAADLNGVELVHSADYRNANSLPPGAVLVVGGGQSGAQIAEDVRAAGREVYLSIADRPSNLRRYRGKDFMELWEVGGVLHQRLEEHPLYLSGDSRARAVLRALDFPLVSGTDGDGLGHTITRKSLHDQGIVMIGRLLEVGNGVARFADMRDDAAAANAATRQIRRELAEIAETKFAPTDLEPAPPHDEDDWYPSTFVEELDLSRAGIGAIIATTGFVQSWPWIRLPRIFDSMGYPLGERGISPFPGLYFLGLFFLGRLSTTCLCNGGQDAAEVVEHLTAFLGSNS